MSLVLKFYFTSSMLNMFRTLIHPSSGACDFSIVSPHWSCVLVSMFWSYGVAGLGWYPCSRLQPATRAHIGITPVFLNLDLRLVEWSASGPDRFTPGEMAPYPRNIKPSSTSVKETNFFSPPGIEHNPYPSHYTD